MTANPSGTDVDLLDLAVSLGLGESVGRIANIHRAVDRLVRFGFARREGTRLLVRRRAGNVPELLTKRLSYTARRHHEQLVSVLRRA